MQVKPAKCFIATQRTNLCIVQNQSTQKRQANTYGTNHNVLPSSFQSGTGKFKGNQECRNQSGCFDCYPHQTQVLYQKYDEHSPNEKLHQSKVTTGLQAFTFQNTANFFASKVRTSSPACSQVQSGNNHQHPRT